MPLGLPDSSPSVWRPSHTEDGSWAMVAHRKRQGYRHEGPPHGVTGSVMKIAAIHRLQAVLGSFYILAGSAKLAGADLMVEAFDVIGLGQRLRLAIGMIEVVGGICLLIPWA